MFRNYFKTAVRSLKRNRSYTIINVAGLGLGLTVCMIIFLIIRFHAGFDNFHPQRKNIYRLLTEYHHADSKDVFYGHGVPFGVPKAVAAGFPKLPYAAPVFADHNDQFLLQTTDGRVKKFKETNGVFFTEPSFFKIFNFPLLAGSYNSLKDPGHCLMTKETAEKYFGDWNTALNQTIRLNSNVVLKISGILATIPGNTDFQLKVVVAMGTGFTVEMAASNDLSNTDGNFGCYLLLPEYTSIPAFNAQLNAVLQKSKNAANRDRQVIQPLADVHYDLKTGSYSEKAISHQLINALWLIAGFILLIACVNFVNLSTAQSVNRAREIGVRKVLGSNRRQVKLQFFSETLLLVLGAVLLAVAITAGVLPVVSNLIELPLSFSFFTSFYGVAVLMAGALVVTGLASFYPSMVLAAFNPITALKSKTSTVGHRGIALRRGLVVFQFIIAQALIIGTLVIVRQMDYFNTQSLGFNKEAVLNVPFQNDSASIAKLSFLRKELLAVNGISQVSFASNTPIEDEHDDWSTFVFDHASDQTDIYSIIKFADEGYVPTYQLPLVAGHNMAASDTPREFLVNQLLLKNLQITNPRDAIGREISIWRGRVKGTIAGVLADFNTRSFRKELAPVIITTRKKNYTEAGIKLLAGNLRGTISSIEKLWNRTFPDLVFEYTFLDDKIAGFYKREGQLAILYQLFAAIAIALSCLGLYGLASFMAVQRVKEVGVRKVLGATAANIVFLFSKEFISLILVAFLIAAPLAAYFMGQWLHNFPFQVNMSAWIFLAGAAVSMIIAFATVGFQAMRAAGANPVVSLKAE